MKKCMAFLSALALCGTMTVFAAPTESLNNKNLVEIATIAETNFDGDVQFDAYGGLGGFTFDGFDAPSADSTAENPKTDVMRILKNPSDPDCDDYYLKISRTVQDGKNHRINLPSSKNYGGGIWVFNLKYMQPVAFEHYFSIKYDTNDWFSGDRFHITDGNVWFGGTQICSGIVPGNWYEYTFIFDAEANTASCIVTGALGGEETTVSKLNMPVTDRSGQAIDFSYVQQMEINCAVLGRVFYVDDLSVKIMAYRPQIEVYGIDADGNRTEDGLVEYAAPRIKAVVSEAVSPDTVGAKPLTLLYRGNEIAADIVFDQETGSFTVTPQVALLPNTAYSLLVAAELKTKQGAPVAGDTPLTLKTGKAPSDADRILEEGAYVSFGQYGGEPIVWRVLSGDADGYFVIADKVLCFKPFDAQGGAWKDSALRTWLNSAEAEVTYLHAPQIGAQLTVNPYDTEKGFLHSDNFTAEELQMLETCSRDVIVRTPSVSVSPGNTDAASRGYIRNPQTAQSDARYADTESVSDKIFLPSVAEIQQMALSHDRFGVEYQVGTPAAYAAEQAGTTAVKTGRGCSYWLSDALFFAAENNYVYTMAPRNVISYARSYNGLMGVRPMCKIKNDRFFISRGDGSAEEPYALSAGQGIRIRAAQEVVMSGEPITVLVTSTFASDTVYELYHNGAICSSLPTARDGVNELYYKVYAQDGTELIESNKISVLGISYNKLADIMSNDFEGDNLFAGFVRQNAPEGYANAVQTDEAHGISLEAKSGNGSSVTATFPRFNQADVTAIEFEFMLPSTDVIQNNLINLKINGSGEWISPLAAADGKLIVEDVSAACGTLELRAGTWYHVGLYLDQDNPSLTVVVTENGVRHILCYRAAFAGTVDSFAYGEITSTGNSTARMNTIYFDNAAVYGCTQSHAALQATAVIADEQAEVSVYNPSAETADLMVFGVVKSRGRLEECQKEDVFLTPADTSRAVSFHFEKQGDIGCMVLKQNLSPIPVITRQ